MLSPFDVVRVAKEDQRLVIQYRSVASLLKNALNSGNATAKEGQAFAGALLW